MLSKSTLFIDKDLHMYVDVIRYCIMLKIDLWWGWKVFGPTHFVKSDQILVCFFESLSLTEKLSILLHLQSERVCLHTQINPFIHYPQICNSYLSDTREGFKNPPNYEETQWIIIITNFEL